MLSTTALLLALSGCLPNTPAETADPSPSPSPAEHRTSESPSEGAIEEAIVAQYLAFWDALAEAADPPDPGHPALEATAAGAQLEQLREALKGYGEQGYVRRGQHTHNPVLRELLDGGTAALVEDCVELDPEAGLFEAETSERVTDPGEPGDRQFAETRMELIDGTWKVVRVNVVEEESECEPAGR